MLQSKKLLIMFALAATAAAQSGWVLRQPAIQPASRGHHALAYDLIRGRTVLFGGWDGSSGLADTWEWSGANWTLKATSSSPPARCGNALATDLSRGRVVLFGGTNSTASGDVNDTWEYDGVDWTQRQPVNRPSARRFARMEYDMGRSRVVLFGGGAGGYGVPTFADTWQWDGNDWTLRNPPTAPPPRWGHGMTYDHARGRMVLFGGAVGVNNLPFADTWTWDGTTWTHVSAATAPPFSSTSGIAYDATRELVVGFVNPGETWLLDGVSWRRDSRTLAPSQRTWSALVHDLLRSRTVLFSGVGAAADTWEYDPGVVARWTAYGAGCAGTAGVPMLRPVGGALPILGSTFTLELLPVPATGVAAIAIGFSDQQWNGHTLPWDLAALGMPGCTMHGSPDFPFFAPIVAGRATLAWPLPNDPGLVDVRFFAQAVAIEPGVNPMGAIVSNAGAGIVGPF